MGPGKHFWEDEAAAIDTILWPANLTIEKLAEIGIFCAETRYRKYETEGFQTPLL